MTALRHDSFRQLLLDKGANVNVGTSDWPPLHVAAFNGHLAVLKTLLDNGANVAAADIHAGTALHKAARNGHIDVVKVESNNVKGQGVRLIGRLFRRC